MNELIAIILVIFGILQIILFFKVWGMTNDAEKIKRMLNLRNRLTFFHNLPPKCENYKGDVFFVKGIFEDSILCVRNENDENIVEFKVNEVNFIQD